jgi:putative transposase
VEIALKHRIDAIFTESPFYGSRRITAALRREGVLINRKAVQRHMREMGLEAIGPGPGGTTRQPGQYIYPYLLRDLVITQPNQVWGIEIVCTQMTKTDVFAGRRGRNHVANFDVVVRHHDPINH